jgi:hypothetical protein
VTRSRAPLLELTLFVEDLDRSRAFFACLGYATEPWPGEEATTVDVCLPLPDAPIVQLFQANDSHPLSRVQLGFQVADLRAVAEALDANGFGWDAPGPNRLETRWQGNRIHVTALDADT